MTRPALDNVLDGLAVWRLTRLVTQDAITGGLRERVREAEEARRGDPCFDLITSDRRWGPQVAQSPGPFTFLVNCTACASVWIAVGAVALRAVSPGAWRALRAPLALSGTALLLEGHAE